MKKLVPIVASVASLITLQSIAADMDMAVAQKWADRHARQSKRSGR